MKRDLNSIAAILLVLIFVAGFFTGPPLVYPCKDKEALLVAEYGPRIHDGTGPNVDHFGRYYQERELHWV